MGEGAGKSSRGRVEHYLNRRALFPGRGDPGAENWAGYRPVREDAEHPAIRASVPIRPCLGIPLCWASDMAGTASMLSLTPVSRVYISSPTTATMSG